MSSNALTTPELIDVEIVPNARPHSRKEMEVVLEGGVRVRVEATDKDREKLGRHL